MNADAAQETHDGGHFDTKKYDHETVMPVLRRISTGRIPSSALEPGTVQCHRQIHEMQASCRILNHESYVKRTGWVSSTELEIRVLVPPLARSRGLCGLGMQGR